MAPGQRSRPEAMEVTVGRGPRSQIVWPSDGSAGGLRERDRTAVAVGVDRPDAEEHGGARPTGAPGAMSFVPSGRQDVGGV
jgi:hypothetical protein